MKRILGIILLLTMVVGCVTTTTGRFQNKKSAEEAERNYVALGINYLKKGQTQRAKEKLNRALELNPDSSIAHHAYALVWQQEDEPELAEEHFEEAISSNGNNSAARHAYGVFLMRRNELSDACDELEEAAEDTAYTNRVVAYNDYGMCEYRQGNLEKAVEQYVRSVRINRFNIEGLVNLTSLYLELKQTENAIRYYRRFTNLVQMRRTAHSAHTLWLGIRLAQIKQDTTSEKSFARQLKKGFPKSSEYKVYQQSKQG